MRQQINLYRDELIDKSEPFQSRQAGLVLVAAVFFLALVGFYSYWQTATVKKEVVGLRQQQQIADARVIELETLYPKPQQSILLQEKIHRIEQQLQGQRKALDYFSKQDQKSNGKILTSLEGLARHPQKGIWLRSISLLRGGQDVQLTGSALKPEQIPDYLQLLGEKNIFAGQVFARLKLNRLSERKGQIDFELDSVLEVTP